MRGLRFTRPVVVLVLAFGLLPMAGRALPSGLPAAGLRVEAGSWLNHLANALGGLGFRLDLLLSFSLTQWTPGQAQA